MTRVIITVGISYTGINYSEHELHGVIITVGMNYTGYKQSYKQSYMFTSNTTTVTISNHSLIWDCCDDGFIVDLTWNDYIVMNSALARTVSFHMPHILSGILCLINFEMPNICFLHLLTPKLFPSHLNHSVFSDYVHGYWLAPCLNHSLDPLSLSVQGEAW